MKIVKLVDPRLDLKYNKAYIGLAKDAQPNNVVTLRPRKNHLILSLKMTKSAEIDDKLDQAELERLGYAARSGKYRIRVSPSDFKKHHVLIKELIDLALQTANSA